jgi:NAD(P)-dependent dehydrogenase (short-subunit alcohol dehydrogenase family)
LLRHYGMEPKATQANSPHENGDVEQRHHRLKRAADQALMLRGSREFADRAHYDAFLKELFAQLNAGRRERFAEEQAVLRRLPAHRLEACSTLPEVRVSGGSITSPAAFIGSASGKSHYAASKAGVVAFTVSLARETAGQGIRVNAVAPGMMYTDMVAQTLKSEEERYNAQIPLGRIARTEEIADVVVFLASGRAG